ncbi:hypothetical protein TWF679_006105, partial [Orbilia oligospora]
IPEGPSILPKSNKISFVPVPTSLRNNPEAGRLHIESKPGPLVSARFNLDLFPEAATLPHFSVFGSLTAMPSTDFDTRRPPSSDRGIDEPSSPSAAASPTVVSAQGNRAGRTAEASSEQGYRGSETGSAEMAEDQEKHAPQSPYVEHNRPDTSTYSWKIDFTKPDETLSDRSKRLEMVMRKFD